jgi:DNA-binding PadR family transcriptional regulator
MTPPPPETDRFRRRVVGLYALTLMDRDGPVHGYRLSEAIAERSDGTWRPGPGAVYPSLQKLVDAGLARRKVEGRRRIYSITARGTALLQRMREHRRQGWGDRKDLSRLWAEVLGTSDMGEFYRVRLRRSLDAIEEHLGSKDLTPVEAARLRQRVVEDLAAGLARVRGRPTRPRAPPRSPRPRGS